MTMMTAPSKTHVTVDLDGEKISVLPLCIEWCGSCWILRGWEAGKDDPARTFVIKEFSVGSTEPTHGKLVEHDP